MADKKQRRYHIQMVGKSTGGDVALPTATVIADEIRDGEYPGYTGGNPIVLLLEGEEVGRFSPFQVAGWWTEDL